MVQGCAFFFILRAYIRAELLHKHANRLEAPMLRCAVEGSAFISITGIDIRAEVLHEDTHRLKMSLKCGEVQGGLIVPTAPNVHVYA